MWEFESPPGHSIQINRSYIDRENVVTGKAPTNLLRLSWSDGEVARGRPILKRLKGESQRMSTQAHSMGLWARLILGLGVLVLVGGCKRNTFDYGGKGKPAGQVEYSVAPEPNPTVGAK